MGKIIFCQLGKNRVTDNFIETLKNNFKKSKIVRIKVLKSACRDKKELEKIKDDLLKRLGENFKARMIGYVIVVRRLRKTLKTLIIL